MLGEATKGAPLPGLTEMASPHGSSVQGKLEGCLRGYFPVSPGSPLPSLLLLSILPRFLGDAEALLVPQ